MDSKNAHLKVAAGEYFLAQAELALAAYNLEQFGTLPEIIAHLKVAKNHLDQTIKNYEKVIALLRPDMISQDSLVWLCTFDYERFYNEALEKGVISDRANLWNQLANYSRNGNPVKSLVHLQDQLISISDILEKTFTQTDIPNLLNLIRQALSAFADSQVLSIMLAVLNDVTPLDKHWAISPRQASQEEFEGVKS
jgi:hypothetical protein